MQTTVSTANLIGIAGCLSDASYMTRKISAFSEEASAEIRPGIMVKEGAAVDGALMVTAQENLLKGVVYYDQTAHKDHDVGDDGYKPKAMMTLVEAGTMWVRVEGTLPVKGDAVRVRTELTAAEPLGYFIVAAVSGKTVDLSPIAKWTGRTGTGIAEVTFDLKNRDLITADA